MRKMKKMLFLAMGLVILSCSSDDEVSEKPIDPTPSEVPVANDDAVSTTEGEELTIAGLLENDELHNNARMDDIDSESENGAEIIDNRDNTYTYIPQADFIGEDSFEYTICDGDGNCDTATVKVTVSDAGTPEAAADSYATLLTVSMEIDDLLANDNIVDSASLTSVDDSNSKGSVSLNEDGIVTYEPAVGFIGEDTFSYTICDDDKPEASCSSALVTITVMEPVAFNVPSEISEYYANVAFSTNAELNYEILQDLSIDKHTTILSYGQRHDYLYEADEDLDNPDNVILMYSGESRYWEEYQSGNNSYTPQTFNTEHIYPQSRLDSEPAVTDLHHLRVADRDLNGLRLNHPYTDGTGTYKLVDGDKWFPGDEWKGDVARMVMYLNVRYGEDFAAVGNLDLFLKWNIEDPVSEFEEQRNEVISEAQGVRNPFIDNPYLATLLWGGDAAENLWE